MNNETIDSLELNKNLLLDVISFAGIEDLSVLVIGNIAPERLDAFKTLNVACNITHVDTTNPDGTYDPAARVEEFFKHTNTKVDMAYIVDINDYGVFTRCFKELISRNVRFIGGNNYNIAGFVPHEIRCAGGVVHTFRNSAWLCDTTVFNGALRNSHELRHGLDTLIDNIALNYVTLVEVGSFAGESASIFASSGKIKEIWCIDPWVAYHGYGSTGDITMLFVEMFFDQVAKKYPDKIHKFKGTLEEFIKNNPNVKPDVVYIDALHVYEHVVSDINNAKKLHPRYICGHDYTIPDVALAVAHELTPRPDGIFCDTSWLIDPWLAHCG